MEEVKDEDFEESKDVPESLEQESVVSQQNNNRQIVDNVLDNAGSEVLHHMGVPKTLANAAIKTNGGALSPHNMPVNKFIKNQGRNQIANHLPSSNDSNRIQNALGKRSVLPNKLSNQGSSLQSDDSNVNDLKDKVANKAISKGITAATGGAVQGKVADAAAKVGTEIAGTFFQKYKKKIIIGAVASFLPIFIILIIIMGETSNSDMAKRTVGYTTSSMTEEELIDQLKHYGYCKNDNDCKKSGSFKVYQKLKDVYNDYKQTCTGTIKNNEPCGIAINTGLILETINYYNNSEESYQTDEVDVEALQAIDETTKNTVLKGLLTLGYYIESAINKQQELNSFLDQIDALALAQAEYIREDCNGGSKYFYQVSFNKYISYLKYGNSSSHDNYKNNTYRLVKNDTCQGPQNDYIESTNISSGTGSGETISGSGKGTEIVNYALKFVGHPYIFGASNLCDNWIGNTNCAVDCSSFVQAVMSNFGISVPRTSKEQRNAGTNIGTDISKAQAGDIICYEGHVAIYMGDGRIVHASNKKEGVKISPSATYRTILAIVRVWE